MKPLPNLNDEAALILRGKRSALSEARREATQRLRDAYTVLDGSEWVALEDAARVCRDYSERLMTLAAMWAEVNGN